MDKSALDRSIVRRLVTHLQHRTTDMAGEVLELPMEIYYSAEHYQREMDVFFRQHPMTLCLSGALPEPGSYLTIDLIGVPLLLTRDSSGGVHALANACRHRGVRVVDGRGTARRFTCPFHAWTYDNAGQLVSVPVPQGFEGMCLADKGLVELPVAEKYGLVVGRLSPGAPVDVDAYLGAELAAELTLLDFAKWELLRDPHIHQVNANWKVTLDTFRENYHFNYLHRRTLAKYAYGGVLTFDSFGRHIRNASAQRTMKDLLDLPEEEWGDVAPHFSYQYFLFPNVCVSFDYRHVEVWVILPRGPHQSEVVHMAHAIPGLSDEDVASLAELAPWICETVVDGEDFWVAGRTEPTIQAGLVDKVVFGRNEPAPQHMHRGLLEELDAAGPGTAEHR